MTQSSSSATEDTSRHLLQMVWMGGLVYAVAVILHSAYRIRMRAIDDFGPVIHEFDPYFNYRATEVSKTHWFLFCLASLLGKLYYLFKLPHFILPLLMISTWQNMEPPNSFIGLITKSGTPWDVPSGPPFIRACNSPRSLFTAIL